MTPGRYVRIVVRDTGVGMGADMLRQIFDPFFTTKGPDRGVGLGLPMAYGTIAAHGGCIEVESEVGKGAVFRVYLPAARGARPTATGSRGPERSRGGEAVLAVDDEEEILDLLGRSLRSLGYAVLAARDGREAVGVYREKRDEIDVVLLDFMMPGMDGEDAFREIRKINPDARVIVASGYDEESRIKPLLDAGADGFVHKPYRLAALSRALRDVLDRKK